MHGTTFHNRYVRFVEAAVGGELGLVLFVGAVFAVMGSRSVHEIGAGLLVAGFGASLIGMSSVMQKIRDSAPPAGRFLMPAGVRSVDRAISAAISLSPDTYRFFWLTVAIGAMALGLGAVMITMG